MSLKGKHLILGSGSPRRRELLSGLDLEFTVDTANSFEENIPEDVPHPQVPLLMARGKSMGFHRNLEDDEILITADTMVLQDSLLLGKPHSEQEAREMLRNLSGRSHEVITGVVIRDSKHSVEFSDTAYVKFEELSEEEIDYYVSHYHPMDKAGSYGIQEWIGYIGISEIKGSFYNIMGFPVHRVWRELKDNF